MIRCFFKLVLLLAITIGVLVYLSLGRGCSMDRFHLPGTSSVAQNFANRTTQSSAQTWGNPTSLPDHFARHGSDFGARNADDYARMAAEFLHRARADGFRAKLDNRGTLRVYDPRTGAFGAYNRDGTTKTFFKPRNASYFDRQPGRRIDLRTYR
ncbi:MAG: hypothetical protein ABI233_08515 [Chthoniobacterales bacterium]